MNNLESITKRQSSGAMVVDPMPGNVFTARHLAILLVIIVLAVSPTIETLAGTPSGIENGGTAPSSLPCHAPALVESLEMAVDPARGPAAAPSRHACHKGNCKQGLTCNVCVSALHLNVPFSTETARFGDVQTIYFRPPPERYATTTPLPGLRPPIT